MGKERAGRGEERWWKRWGSEGDISKDLSEPEEKLKVVEGGRKSGGDRTGEVLEETIWGRV